MTKRKRGSFVYVKDVNVLKDSFSSWIPCQVFKVSEQKKSSDGKTYVWVESYSRGLEPRHVKTATPAQVRQYKKERESGAYIEGHTGKLITPRKRGIARRKDIRKVVYIPVHVFISGDLSDQDQKKAMDEIMRGLADKGFSMHSGFRSYEKKKCRIKDIIVE